MCSTIIHHDLGSLMVLEKENLCKIIDRGECWKQLGLLMQFDRSVLDVRKISPFSSHDESEISYQFFIFLEYRNRSVPFEKVTDRYFATKMDNLRP